MQIMMTMLMMIMVNDLNIRFWFGFFKVPKFFIENVCVDTVALQLSS